MVVPPTDRWPMMRWSNCYSMPGLQFFSAGDHPSVLNTHPGDGASQFFALSLDFSLVGVHLALLIGLSVLLSLKLIAN